MVLQRSQNNWIWKWKYTSVKLHRFFITIIWQSFKEVRKNNFKSYFLQSDSIKNLDIDSLLSIMIFCPSFSNTVLMQYDGDKSGYGSGGSLGNSLFPKYKHHKLNLNSLKNYGYIHLSTTQLAYFLSVVCFIYFVVSNNVVKYIIILKDVLYSKNYYSRTICKRN